MAGKNDIMKAVDTSFRKQYGVSLSGEHFRMMNGGEVVQSWQSLQSFVDWAVRVVNAGVKVAPCSHVQRIDITRPYGPDNCYFATGRCDEDATTRKEGKRFAIAAVSEATGKDWEKMWEMNVETQKFDPKVWSKEDFLTFILDMYYAGKLTPDAVYMHKIRSDEPYSSENVYFSARRDNGKSIHGMSGSNIYQMFMNWRNYYGSVLGEYVTLEDFVRHAINCGYEHHNACHTRRDDKDAPVLLDDVFFTDTGIYTDFRRIHEVYQTIPPMEDEFGSEKNFISWSIMNGYRSNRDFRKVAPGPFSPDTCVWDIFVRRAKKERTERPVRKGKEGSSGKGISLSADERIRYNNWKHEGGLCKQWNDSPEKFAEWCRRHNITKGVKVSRRNTKKPFGPRNINIQ